VLLNLYGSTETSGDATCHALTRETVSQLPSTEAFVPLGLPITGCEVEVNGEGVLVVKGAVVAKGYYTTDSSGHAFGGRFITNDVVEQAEHGVLRFRGRADGVVKVRGLRVGLEEAEARARKSLGVATTDAAVVLTDEGKGLGKSLTLVVKKQVSVRPSVCYTHSFPQGFLLPLST
jgi:acyl-coenzyme A synthetase/AMP-(fatty) acid ligase